MYNDTKLRRRGYIAVDENYRKLMDLETTPEALEATVSYLTQRMKPFLQTLEPVLICFPDEGPASLGGIFKEAALRCEAMPVFWGPDYRWKELLKLAFETHANTIVGHPLVILGLTKLVKATATPLYVYDVIVGGYPFGRWMVKSLREGLDCKIWGSYAVRSGPVLAGFTCPQEAGIHIREDVLRPFVRDEAGNRIDGTGHGRLYFESVKAPNVVYDPQETATVQYQPCSCGCDEPRVVATHYIGADNPSRAALDETILSWSSVLDYRVSYTESGMALEMVVFPGEFIPKLPSFAKMDVRPWDPERDVPFCMEKYTVKIPEKAR